ncbi:MAG: lysophospholipase, partial [Dongiaceae bacterium]
YPGYGQLQGKPFMDSTTFTAADGAKLALRHWEVDNPKAIAIGVHGFNDYSKSFEGVAQFFNAHQIDMLAYDQRGFGMNPKPGRWHGSEAMRRDLADFILAVREEYQHVPLYVIGDSMGGAITATTMAQYPHLPVKGIILSAPATWGRSVMPFYQTAALWLSSHTLPWLDLSARPLDLKPSNNIEMLRELGRDPYVLKSARVDALAGITDLMDEALALAPHLTAPALIVYGANDVIVPKPALCAFMKKLPPQSQGGDWRLAIYKDGYHMLLRDLEAPLLYHDILAWMEDKTAPLSHAFEESSAANPRAVSLCK